MTMRKTSFSSLMLLLHRHTDSHYRRNSSANRRLIIQRFDIGIGDYKYGGVAVDTGTDQSSPTRM